MWLAYSYCIGQHRCGTFSLSQHFWTGGSILWFLNGGNFASQRTFDKLEVFLVATVEKEESNG